VLSGDKLEKVQKLYAKIGQLRSEVDYILNEDNILKVQERYPDLTKEEAYLVVKDMTFEKFKERVDKLRADKKS
jgi:hypothetical protein